MSGIADAQAKQVINFTLVNTPATAAATAIKMRLGSTVGTPSSGMTESSWTGYTAGGTACVFGAASGSGGSISATNTGTPSWTNSSGSSQTIEGIDLRDATPEVWWYGAWTGQPITLANGNTFAVASAAVSCSLTST